MTTLGKLKNHQRFTLVSDAYPKNVYIVHDDEDSAETVVQHTETLKYYTLPNSTLVNVITHAPE